MRRLTVATSFILAFGLHAGAQDRPVELTAAGKAILEAKLADDSDRRHDRLAADKPLTFPLAMCAFPGGLCGAVGHDGHAAVPPRYDWVGSFVDGRAAVRIGGLYGFVDERGQEIVPPRYRIVGDYKFGFAQVDIGGKSGIIDRDGKLVLEPKYGFVEAISSDWFRVSDKRPPGGTSGAEEFPDSQFYADDSSGIVDRAGDWIKAPGVRTFDPDERSIRIAQSDNLWGLQRGYGWLVRPQFNYIQALSDGLALVRMDGRYGFIDRTGQIVINPVFDEASAFTPGFPTTIVRQAKSVGTIDRAGAWVFRILGEKLQRAQTSERNGATQFGWHFERNTRWGLLDLEGHVLLDAAFDRPLQRCNDGHLVGFRGSVRVYFKSDLSPLQAPDGQIVDAGCGVFAPYVVKAGDKFGLVNGDGNTIAPPAFDALIVIAKDIWNAKRDGKWGRIGPDGHWLFKPKFNYLSQSDPVIVAATDTKRGVLNADGSWLIAPRFDAARSRDAETAFVSTDGTAGVIRVKDQSWAVAPRPGTMCPISYGILSQDDGRRTILSPTGEVWIDAQVDRLGIDLEMGLLPFQKDGKWGLIDTAGAIAIQPIYDEQVSFRASFRGIAWARHDGRWCPIDRHGRDVPGIACLSRSPLGEGGGYFKCAVEP